MVGLPLLLALLLCCASVQGFGMRHRHASVRLTRGATALMGNPKGRAWAKGDLSDKDIFEDSDDVGGADSKKKDKVKLDPETVFFEGAPAKSELLLPGLSVLTILGIVPFISALSRQAWVRYKFTSRRISIQSGVGGKSTTEIIYPDIEEIRFVYRAFGAAGDMVLFLKDGAKVELRFVPNFESIFEYIMTKCDDECKAKSMKLAKKKEVEGAGAGGM